MENRAFMYTLVNKLFLATSQVAEDLPEGGDWLERVIENLSQRVFSQFERDYYPLGTKPLNYAHAWIRLLGKQGFLNESHYQFSEEAGNDIKVAIANGSCAYREYCRQAQREGLLFLCPRLTSIKWIIASSMGQSYKVSIEAIDCEGECIGIIYPSLTDS